MAEPHPGDPWGGREGERNRKKRERERERLAVPPQGFGTEAHNAAAPSGLSLPGEAPAPDHSRSDSSRGSGERTLPPGIFTMTRERQTDWKKSP